MRFHTLPLPFAAAALAFTLLAAHAKVEAADDTKASSSAIAQGKRIFVAQGCYQCHGYVGQGAPATGPSLVGQRVSGAALISYIRHPGGVMPAFSETLLPDDQARLVAAYVGSLGAGRPPSSIALLASYVADIPAAAPLSATRPVAATAAEVATATPADAPVAAGKALYAANCAACHGADLAGGVGPSLQGQAKKRSIAQIAQLIMAPPAAMPKLYPTPLDGDQVKAVAAYVHDPS